MDPKQSQRGGIGLGALKHLPESLVIPRYDVSRGETVQGIFDQRGNMTTWHTNMHRDGSGETQNEKEEPRHHDVASR